MKILVTGATGFVGSHFVQEALRRNFEVIALRRDVSSVTRIPLDTQPEWVQGLLDADFKDLVDLRSVDAIVHLAAHTPNLPYGSLEDCLYWNVTALSKLIFDAHSVGVHNFIIAGTCFEYGYAAEGQLQVHPSTELKPVGSYPISKALSSRFAVEVARHLGLKLQILRLFQVFGEGELATRLWPSMYQAAQNGADFRLSAGTQVRDFINVTDVAKRLCDALDFQDIGSGESHIRNVGTGVGLSVLEFAQKCWLEFGAQGKLIVGELPLRSTDVPRLVANVRDVYVS